MTVTRSLRTIAAAVPLLALLAGCADRAPTAVPAKAPPVPAAGFDFRPGPALADPATSLAASATLASSPVGLLWQDTRNGRRVRWTLGADGTYAGTFAELRNAPANYVIEATADFNGDGNPDLVWKNTTTGARTIWLMIGAYWYTYVNLPNLGTGVDVLGAGDFNHDGKPDLVLRTRYDDIRIHFMDGTSWGAGEVLLGNLSRSATLAGVADFDGDGNPDLVWNYPGDPAQHYVWFMDGATLKNQQPLPESPYYWRISAVGDVNGDGKPDLVWTHTISGERVIWLMDGLQWHGAYASLPTVPLEWQIVSLMPIPITSPLPDVTVGGVAQDSTSATLTGTLNPHGLPGTWWFEYRASGNNGDFRPTQPRTVDPVTTPQTVSETVFQLTTGFTYEYRLVVTNAAGTTRSGSRTFTVGAVPTGVSTGPATFNSTTIATITGVLDPHGNLVEQWFEHGTSPNLSGATPTVERSRQWTGPQTVSEQIPVTAGNTYYYRIVARDPSGTVRGAIDSVKAVAPTTPVNVTATAYYDVLVRWHNPTRYIPVNDYDVFRNGSHLAVVHPDSLVDGTIPVDSARTWSYQVKACNAFGCSGLSAPAQAVNTPLPAPSNLVATPLGGGKVQLTWQDNSTGEIWFTVQQKTPGSSTWNTVVTTAPNATSYTVALGPVAGQTYQFRVFSAVYAYSSANAVKGVRNSAPAQTSAVVN